MYINIKSLSNELKNAPKPKHPGETHPLNLMNRTDEVNQEKNIRIEKEITFTLINLVAVQYCTSPNDCWLEWEINIDESGLKA